MNDYMEKETIVLKVSVHWVKAAIMNGIFMKKINLEKDSLRFIAEKINVPNKSAQVVKHHLEQLVNMGTLSKIAGQYVYTSNTTEPFTPYKPA